MQNQMTPLQYLQHQQQLQAAGLSQSQQSAGVVRVGSYSSLGGASTGRSASGRRPRGQSFQGAPSSLGGLMPVSPQRGMMGTAQPMQGAQLDQVGQMSLLNQQTGLGLGTSQGGQAAPATSLLAQQLAEHSGGAGGAMNNTLPDNNLNVGGVGMASDMSLAQSLNAGMGGGDPNMMLNNAASFDAGSFAGGTSMSYVSANGTPMMISASDPEWQCFIHRRLRCPPRKVPWVAVGIIRRPLVWGRWSLFGWPIGRLASAPSPTTAAASGL